MKLMPSQAAEYSISYLSMLCDFKSAQSISIIQMQVYQRFQRLMHRLEPTLAFAEGDFIGCLNTLIEATASHQQLVPALMPEILAIMPDMLATRNAFSLPDYADLFSFFVNTYKLLPEKSHEYCQQLLDAAILALSNIPLQVGPEWSHPILQNDDGVDISEAVEIRICTEVLSKVNQLIVGIGLKWARVYLAPSFRKHCELYNDWRQKYGAMMVAAQLVEETEELSEVKCYIDAALPELRSQHPKMKYAALELLGQMAETLKPAIQEAYFEAIVPQLLKLLWDEIPRVASHALACLSNFLMDFKQFWKVQAILNDLLPPVLHYLNGSDNYMQKCAFQVVTSLVGVKNCLGANVGILVQACGELLQKSQQVRSKQMMEDVFQTLSTLLCCQDQQHVAIYLPHFVQSFLANHQILSDQIFFDSWSKICGNYKGFVTFEGNNIMETLLVKVDRMFKQDIGEVSLIGLDGLSSTFICFQSALKPFTGQIYQFLKEALDNKEYQDDVRNKSIELIVQLLLATKAVDNDEGFLNQAMNCLQFLIAKGDQYISNQGEIYLLSGVLNAMISLIEPLSCILNSQIVIRISDRLLAYKRRIEELTTVVEVEQGEAVATSALNNNQDSSYEEMSEDQDDSSIELLVTAELIPEVYTKLLTYASPPDRQMLLSILIPQISFAMAKGEEWKAFGLALALSIVEGCSYQDVSGYWGDLMGLFIGYIYDPKVELRSISIYGIGIIFEKTPASQVSGNTVAEWLQVLSKCMETPFEADEDKGNVKHCQDNIISALGNLLKSYGMLHPQILTAAVYQKWLSALPLKHDEQEQAKQHEILLEMLASTPAVLLSDANGLKRILEIMADYLLLHPNDKQDILAKTKQCFSNMTQWQIFQRSSNYLWDNLSMGQKTILAKLANSQ